MRLESFQLRKGRVQLADFPQVVLKVESLRQRKVRVTLADFALDALEDIRDASVWRLAALWKKTFDFREV